MSNIIQQIEELLRFEQQRLQGALNRYEISANHGGKTPSEKERLLVVVEHYRKRVESCKAATEGIYNLMRWSKEATESTRATVEKFSDGVEDNELTIPSWLPELEAAISAMEAQK